MGDVGGEALGGEIFLLHRDVLLDPMLVQPGKRWIAHRLPATVRMCMCMCVGEGGEVLEAREGDEARLATSEVF